LSAATVDPERRPTVAEDPGPITLCSSSLLSKWGFDDGDLPESVWDHLDDTVDDDEYRRLFDASKPALVRLVREFLLPALDQQVEVVEIVTSHNPIRASTVNGVDVEDCWHGNAPNPELTPEYVEVPMPEVLRIAAARESCHVLADPEGPIVVHGTGPYTPQDVAAFRELARHVRAEMAADSTLGARQAAAMERLRQRRHERARHRARMTALHSAYRQHSRARRRRRR
jgi:hypothetical protein